MSFVVGIGLDRHARADQFGEQRSETGEPLAGDFLELRAMLLHHPLVVVGGERREALGQQVVVGVAPLHLDHLALLSEVFDVVDEQ